MTTLAELWLPIILSSVLVFVVSSLIHMASPWHKNDYPRLPREDEFRSAVGALEIPEGDYMVPRPSSREELRSEAFAEKYRKGPNVIMTVLPNADFSMGRNLGLWFAYLIVVSVFAAYVAGRALPHGTEYIQVFRFAGTVAFIGYSVALWQMSIWYRRSWSITIKATIDGLIYGLLTAGVMGWLWPR
ncbi:MAG TPA: hypothetical protein VHM24_03895 [Gemmatimonadaceae bacterium]|nr:hypothetical protein [Gemmatimonadaceae bacterium]